MFLLFLMALAGPIPTASATSVSLTSTTNVVWHDASPLAQAVAPKSKPSPKAFISHALSANTTTINPIPAVPFYSQFADITSPKWQKVGCGITDLTMLIHYYRPGASVTVNQMLAKGIATGAYDNSAGWTYQGLIDLGKPYDLTGTWYTLPNNSGAALARLKTLLADGPLILSVHYKFDPASTIPHLVVVNAIQGGTVYVNDPATTKGTKEISIADFLKGWKRKVIVIRPKTDGGGIALAKK